MNEPIDYIASKRAEIKALEDLNNKVTNNKAQFSMNAVGVLLKTLQEIASDILDNQEKEEHFDKELGDKISGSISKAVEEFTKIKPPVVNFSPNINVDIRPIANELEKQNKNIISLLEKMPKEHDDKYLIECYKLIVGMVAKNNELVEKAFSKTDNSNQTTELMTQLIAALNNKPLSIKTKRDKYDNLEIVPVYK